MSKWSYDFAVRKIAERQKRKSWCISSGGNDAGSKQCHSAGIFGDIMLRT